MRPTSTFVHIGLVVEYYQESPLGNDSEAALLSRQALFQALLVQYCVLDGGFIKVLGLALRWYVSGTFLCVSH